jgi:hypothetical protein
VRAFGGAALMAVLLLVYLGVAGIRAAAFFASGQPAGIGIGAGLVVLLLLGLYLLARELGFGLRATRLTRRLAREEPLPGADLPRRPSGRVERSAADAVFDRYRLDAEAHPDDWRAWLRIGLAYDQAGDRRRARAAVRRAIALES